MNETYKRQISLIGEEGQERLKNSVVFIVGAGGIGNIAAKYLASSGIGELIILDNDIVEKSNLNRQILFNKKVIGKNKAFALYNTLEKINPDILITAHPFKFDEKYMDYYKPDLVLDCADNLETSYLLEKKCIEDNIPLVFAKTSKYFGVVTIIKDKPYLERNYPTKQLNKDHSVFPVIGGIVGSYQANLALKLILGLKVTDKVIHFDCLNDNIIKYEKAYSI